MARSDRRRYAPMSLALIAFIVTFVAVLYYGIAESPDHAEPAVVATPTPPEPLEAALEAIAVLRAEVAAARAEAALAREQAALAGEEAALAREAATALAEDLLEVARRYDETVAGQEALAAGLAEALELPRITVRMAEPKVVVHTAEPEVTLEQPPSGVGAAGPQVEVERSEPRVRIERAPTPPGRRD